MLSKLLLLRYKCLFPVVTKWPYLSLSVLRIKTASVLEPLKKKKAKTATVKKDL